MAAALSWLSLSGATLTAFSVACSFRGLSSWPGTARRATGPACSDVVCASAVTRLYVLSRDYESSIENNPSKKTLQLIDKVRRYM